MMARASCCMIPAETKAFEFFQIDTLKRNDQGSGRNPKGDSGCGIYGLKALTCKIEDDARYLTNSPTGLHFWRGLVA